MTRDKLSYTFTGDSLSKIGVVLHTDLFDFDSYYIAEDVIDALRWALIGKPDYPEVSLGNGEYYFNYDEKKGLMSIQSVGVTVRFPFDTSTLDDICTKYSEYMKNLEKEN